MCEDKKYKFKGKVVRKIYDSNKDNYKIYALDVDKKTYPDISHNGKYGNVTIQGDLHILDEGIEYEITAVEQTSKYGIGYKVLNIKRDKPTTAEDMYIFLSEILTHNQAETLYENYPDIVQRVKENRLDDIDFNKLKGIKEYTFNTIVKKITDNFCLTDLVIEFQGYLSLSMLKKIYEKYPSVETLKLRLSQNPYECLCSISGVGFKTADSILLEIEKISNSNIKNGKAPIINFEYDLKTSVQRCTACLIYLLESNENNGHTKMNIANLREECIKLVSSCADKFVEAVKNPAIYYDKEEMDIALNKTYMAESKIATEILSNINNKNVWEYDLEKYRNVNGFDLSDEQMQVLVNVCKYSISILNGAGGTGKSFSTQAVINMLKEHDKSFKLFSPTGKAAKVLSDYTKETATTIHRGLGYVPPNTWVINDTNKLDCDVLIIDEFSMVDVFLMKRVIDAIDLTRTKLLLIGDNAQLPSVSCGNLLHDFMVTNLIPTTTLTNVFRYGEGGLMKVATDVRFCKQYLTSSMKNKMTVFGNNKDYVFVDLPSDNIPRNVIGLYKKLLNQGYGIEDIQVLTAKNVGECGTIVLNNLIQKVANHNYGSNINMKYGQDKTMVTYYEGDMVIQKLNNYEAIVVDSNWNEVKGFDGKSETAFVANGENGIIKKINKEYMIIDFDGITVKYYKNNLKMIGLGYSITIHKSQGSSIKVVILCTPKSHIFMLNSNLIYVGLTRMKEKCFHLGTFSSVNLAVTRKENLSRFTFMKRLLAS